MRCPRCGFEIDVPSIRRKGESKATASEQSRLSSSQRMTLEALTRLGAFDLKTAIQRQGLYAEMRDAAIDNEARIPSSHMVSYWLSSLLGIGFVIMENAECQMIDPETKEIRWRRKPVWYLSPDYIQGRLRINDQTGKILR